MSERHPRNHIPQKSRILSLQEGDENTFAALSKKPTKKKVVINTGSEDDGQQLGKGPANRLQPEKIPRSVSCVRKVA